MTTERAIPARMGGQLGGRLVDGGVDSTSVKLSPSHRLLPPVDSGGRLNDRPPFPNPSFRGDVRGNNVGYRRNAVHVRPPALSGPTGPPLWLRGRSLCAAARDARGTKVRAVRDVHVVAPLPSATRTCRPPVYWGLILRARS